VGGGKNNDGQGKIKTSLFDGVLSDNERGKEGRGNQNHPANSKQQKEQGLYRDPPRGDRDRPKSAQQVRLLVERAPLRAVNYIWHRAQLSVLSRRISSSSV
jgi:hypothetical protein